MHVVFELLQLRALHTFQRLLSYLLSTSDEPSVGVSICGEHRPYELSLFAFTRRVLRQSPLANLPTLAVAF